MSAQQAQPGHPAESPGPAPGPGPDLTPDLASALHEVTAGRSRFGHREHIHLAFIAARRYGPDLTAAMLCGWIGQIARAHGAPEKYHETLTVAWARLVADHVVADDSLAQCRGAAGNFTAFVSRHPELMDKDLLKRHYSEVVLYSAAARVTWTPPDLAALPFG